MRLGRKALESVTRELAITIGSELRRHFGVPVGFALLLFDFGDGGDMAYISNNQRESMISLVKEWLALLEGGLTTEPPGPRGEG